MQTVLDQGIIARTILERTNGEFGKQIGIISKLFGCWHKNLSRPFTNKQTSYRACLQCGARKKFDAKTLKTSGKFHYPPAVSYIEK